MTTVVPPPPPMPVPAAGRTATLIVPNPPEALTQLPPGSIIDAQLISALSNGSAEIQTAFGKLDIRTSFPLPKNAKLEIQLLRLTPHLLLAIKAVNGGITGANTGHLGSLNTTTPGASGAGTAGQAAAVQNTAASANGARPAVTTQSQGVSATINLDIGSVVKATLLRSLGAGGLAGSASSNTSTNIGQSSGQAGGQVTTMPGQQAGIQPGSSSSGQIDMTQSANTQGTANPGVAASALESGATPKQLPTGTQFKLRMLATSSHSTSPSGSAQPNSHNIASGQTGITGTVVASTPSGQPIVFTSMGMIGLDSKTSLEPGTNLQLEIVSTLVKSAGTPIVESSVGNLYHTREWPNLETALDQISQSAPNVSQQVVSNTIPQANTQLTTNMLFFMSALKGGDVRSWIGGEASNILDQTNPELLGRLSDDFGQLGRVFTENQPNDWRTALVPFFTGSGFEQVQMHMRGQKDQEGPDGEEDTSRFIIDVELSQLGRVQLDGLVKSKGKKFDLIVRTEAPLPAVMRKEINHIFADFTEVTGVNGAIVFQADKKFAEIELPYLTDEDHSGVIV